MDHASRATRLFRSAKRSLMAGAQAIASIGDDETTADAMPTIIRGIASCDVLLIAMAEHGKPPDRSPAQSGKSKRRTRRRTLADHVAEGGTDNGSGLEAGTAGAQGQR